MNRAIFLPRDPSDPGFIAESILAEVRGSPIPDPDVMKEYELLYPGAAAFFFAELQRQTDHRLDLEARIVESDISNQTRRAWFGFTLVLSALLGGPASDPVP